MAFHVGQKVVCVDAKPRMYPTSLREGEVYTVTAVNPGEWVGLLIAEVEPHPATFDFFADRFRPAVERRTDTGMAVLRKIAADISAKVTVRAKAPSSERA